MPQKILQKQKQIAHRRALSGWLALESFQLIQYVLPFSQLESNLKEKIQQLENFEERENDLEEQLKKEVATKVNNFVWLTLKGTELVYGEEAESAQAQSLVE